MIIFLLLVGLTEAHVSLTFPPARYPPLDFLDNIRTIGPCGVPRPRVPRFTDLYIGETYNISWRMQYLHKGGYRLTLLSESGEVVEQVAPKRDTDEFTHSNDSTVRTAVYRPTNPCHHCILRLERQALEWGESYRLWSCADVNIVGGEPTSDDLCSGNGVFKDGECDCRHLYSGELCQYKDYCSTDVDCLNGGKCVQQNNSLVRKTCFCAFGYFGQNCAQTNTQLEQDGCFNYKLPLKAENFSNYGLFDPECYIEHQLSDEDSLYSRIVGNELELIMDYKGTSWVAVGWRPLLINKSCRLFPDLENIRWKRNVKSGHVAKRHETSDFLMSPRNASRMVDPNDLRPVPIAKPPKNNGFLETALSAPLHPMDCTDVITAAVVDGRLRVNDMYSRDRSTPLVDTWVDGDESLTAAFGIEKNGRTVVMFRRDIAEIEPSDHPLGPGKLFVVYAKGEVRNGTNRTTQPLTDEEQRENEVYHDDELDYQGFNKETFELEFVPHAEYFRPGSWGPDQNDNSSILEASLEADLGSELLSTLELEKTFETTSGPKSTPEFATGIRDESVAQLGPERAQEQGSNSNPGSKLDAAKNDESKARTTSGSSPNLQQNTLLNISWNAASDFKNGSDLVVEVPAEFDLGTESESSLEVKLGINSTITLQTIEQTSTAVASDIYRVMRHQFCGLLVSILVGHMLVS